MSTSAPLRPPPPPSCASFPGKTEGTVTGPGVVSGGNTFYPVTIGGTTGYLAGSYLQRITATATPSRTRTPTATVVGSTVRYTSDDVNMRTGPGTNYGKVATIPKGTRVNITGTPRRSGGIDWYPVVVNGVGSGWMAGSFLKPCRPFRGRTAQSLELRCRGASPSLPDSSPPVPAASLPARPGS